MALSRHRRGIDRLNCLLQAREYLPPVAYGLGKDGYLRNRYYFTPERYAWRMQAVFENLLS